MLVSVLVFVVGLHVNVENSNSVLQMSKNLKMADKSATPKTNKPKKQLIKAEQPDASPLIIRSAAPNSNVIVEFPLLKKNQRAVQREQEKLKKETK